MGSVLAADWAGHWSCHNHLPPVINSHYFSIRLAAVSEELWSQNLEPAINIEIMIIIIIIMVIMIVIIIVILIIMKVIMIIRIKIMMMIMILMEMVK